MDQFVNPARCCPQCDSKDYVFRGQKRIAADPARAEEAAIVTKS